MIHPSDTCVHGKPDIVKLTYRLVKEFDAEAVCFLSFDLEVGADFFSFFSGLGIASMFLRRESQEHI